MDFDKFNSDIQLETDPEILAKGNEVFDKTIQFMMLYVDPAYSFILGRFNRTGIKHDDMDCMLLLQSDGAPCIGVNYSKFLELSELAQVSIIEHQIGHIMSGHLGNRLHINLKEYCATRYGVDAGHKLYRLVVETAADSFVSYPGALKDHERTYLDVRKLGLPRWVHTMSILKRVEDLIKESGGGGADQQQTEELLNELASKMAGSALWKDGGKESADSIEDMESNDTGEDGPPSLGEDGIYAEAAEAATVGEDNVQKIVEEAVSRNPGQKDRGYMSGDTGQFIAARRKPPEVSWIQQLNKAMGSGLSSERRVTRKRLNRRNQDFGFGRVTENITKICVIIDTSGSMRTKELNKLDAELKVMSQLTDDDIDIVHCDARVAKHEAYRRGMDLTSFIGRGGTRFTPALEYVRDKLPEQPGLVVYFTDGYGERLDDDDPILPPWDYRIIWILTPDGLSKGQFRDRITQHGTVIKVKKWL